MDLTHDIDPDFIFERQNELAKAMARLFESGKITRREYKLFIDSIIQAPLAMKVLISGYAINDELLLALLKFHPKYKFFKGIVILKKGSNIIKFLEFFALTIFVLSMPSCGIGAFQYFTDASNTGTWLGLGFALFIGAGAMFQFRSNISEEELNEEFYSSIKYFTKEIAPKIHQQSWN